MKPTLAKHPPVRWVVAVLRIGSSVLFIVAAYAMIGLWVGKVNRGTKWVPEDPGMAFNTAFCFLVVSILFSVVARYINAQSNSTRTHRGPGGGNRVLHPAGIRQGRSH